MPEDQTPLDPSKPAEKGGNAGDPFGLDDGSFGHPDRPKAGGRCGAWAARRAEAAPCVTRLRRCPLREEALVALRHAHQERRRRIALAVGGGEGPKLRHQRR